MYISIGGLLQIVMVSPGTYLVKIHESQFTTIESQFKNKSPGSFCNHTVNLKIDSKTLSYSLLKLKYTPSNVKHNKGKKEICVIKQQPQEHPQKSHKEDILEKHLKIDQSIFASYGTHTTNYSASLGIFICIRDAGRRDNKITALSNHLIFSTAQKSVQKETQIRIHLRQLVHNQKSGSTLISEASHADLPKALSDAPS